ncbi:MAG: hypothetical protein ACREKH_11305, partial [Candidatus Rokuibacteriota bacterium]
SEWLGLVAGDGSRLVASATRVLVAGAEVPVIDDAEVSRAFVRYRHLAAQNVGPNVGQIVVMGSQGTAATFNVNAGASRELPSEVLGRGTITLVSAVGTSMQILLGMW